MNWNKTAMLCLSLLLLTVLLPSGQAAAVQRTRPGILDVSTADGVSAVPNAQADGDFYPDARSAAVTVSGVVDGGQYMIFALSEQSLPNAENLEYVGQAAAANGAVSFPTVSPKHLQNGVTYSIYVTGPDRGLDPDRPDAQFSYFRPYLPGDVDFDGTVTASDALCALRMSVGSGSWTELQRLAANVDDDDVVTASDALKILNAAVGLIDLEA